MSDGFDVPLNFNAITNRLLLGSRPRDLTDLQMLRAHGVSHILNVCDTEDGPYDWTALGITDHLWNRALDDGAPKPPSWFQASLSFAMPLLAKPGWILYVHCFNGYDRSAATVYAILRAWGFGEAEAWLVIKSKRPESLWRYIANANTAIAGEW
jgi:hypothetical protein